MPGSGSSARCWMPALFLAGALVGVHWAQEPSKPSPPTGERLERAAVQQFVTQHCTSCHNSDEKAGGLDLDAVSSEDVAAHPEVWEKVVRKLAARQMPPAGRPRPDERTYDVVRRRARSRRSTARPPRAPIPAAPPPSGG